MAPPFASEVIGYGRLGDGHLPVQEDGAHLADVDGSAGAWRALPGTRDVMS